MSIFTEMKGLYPVKKTLRFELKPQGETLKHINEKGFIQKDEIRANEYKELKKIIDNYHKYFIDTALAEFKFEETEIKENLPNNLDDKKKKSDENNEKKKLYKKIGSHFKAEKWQLKDNVLGSGLFKQKGKQDGELIKFLALDKNVILSEERKHIETLINNFKNFTTYFTGFNTNRENIYSNEGKFGSIAFRIVDENMPKFLKNCNIYKKIKNTELFNSFSDEEKKTYETVFIKSHYNSCLTQKCIDEYNNILGGISKENNIKVKGINEKINLYNQKNPDKKINLMVRLYDQILSERKTASFVYEVIENEAGLVCAINDFIEEYEKIVNKNENIFSIVDNLSEQTTNIYLLNDIKLTDFSKSAFDDWQYIKNKWNDNYAIKNWSGKANITKKDYENRNKAYKDIKQFELQEIFICLNDEDKNKLIKESKKIKDFKETIKSEYESALKYLNGTVSNLRGNEQAIVSIKKLLDEIKKLQVKLSIFKLKDEYLATDSDFYNIFNVDYEVIADIIPLYNKVRNYLTKKPYSDDKIKINFENTQFLEGWDKNKEKERRSILLRKKNKNSVYNYYLGIIDGDSKKLFEEYKVDNYAGISNSFEKMNYKQIALPTGVGGFVRKCFNSCGKLGWECPDEYLIITEKGGKEIIIRDIDVSAEKLSGLIDCYKDFFNKYEKDGFEYKDYGFKFKNSDEYKKLSEFFSDVERQSYKLEFNPISEDFINENVEKGNLYLFQIYNKDFSENSNTNGMPNLHTLYFKALFCDENLKNGNFKLSGGGEMFWRKASLLKSITHQKNQPIKNKRIDNPKIESKFEYDLIKNKRFTEDKFFLHMPIEINRINKRRNYINSDTNEIISRKENKEKINIIGVDRGERHLLYAVLIDYKGNIKQQFSLNEIINECNDKKYKTDYHAILNDRENERQSARINWQNIEGIKNIKSGYLSQVVHKIVNLAIDNNALIFLENLNSGFKNTRKKVEKQVYQNFEKALLDKLNYIVNKDKDESKVLNGLQLANKFESFEKLRGQSGIIFYIPAAYTSAVDPTTGYIDIIKPKYESVEKAKNIIKKFESFKWNNKEQYFEININWLKTANKDKEYGKKTNWTVCSFGDKINTYQEKASGIWKSEKLDVTNKLKDLFSKNSFDFISESDIIPDILKCNSVDFFRELMWLLGLIFKVRHSYSGTQEDYILSPVKNSPGKFFDSREQINITDPKLPVNADANGAYHIALKGLFAVKFIQNGEKYDLKNKNWFDFITSRNL